MVFIKKIVTAITHQARWAHHELFWWSLTSYIISCSASTRCNHNYICEDDDFRNSEFIWISLFLCLVNFLVPSQILRLLKPYKSAPTPFITMTPSFSCNSFVESMQLTTCFINPTRHLLHECNSRPTLWVKTQFKLQQEEMRQNGVVSESNIIVFVSWLDFQHPQNYYYMLTTTSQYSRNKFTKTLFWTSSTLKRNPMSPTFFWTCCFNWKATGNSPSLASFTVRTPSPPRNRKSIWLVGFRIRFYDLFEK